MKKKITFGEVSFLASAFAPESFLHLKNEKGALLPQIAIVGRSNVGKSSLINHLLKKKLAKTSQTPGKTESVNFYKADHLLLVDLPGYGYASRSQAIRKKWSHLIDSYLKGSPALRLILLLIDSRRTFSQEDLALMEWADFHKIPFLLIFTKIDKLNQSEKKKLELSVASLSIRPLRIIPYSIKEETGRMILFQTMHQLTQ